VPPGGEGGGIVGVGGLEGGSTGVGGGGEEERSGRAREEGGGGGREAWVSPHIHRPALWPHLKRHAEFQPAGCRFCKNFVIPPPPTRKKQVKLIFG